MRHLSLSVFKRVFVVLSLTTVVFGAQFAVAVPPVPQILPSTFSPVRSTIPGPGEGLCVGHLLLPNTVTVDDDSPNRPSQATDYSLSQAVNQQFVGPGAVFFTHPGVLDFSNYFTDPMNPNLITTAGDYQSACTGNSVAHAANNVFGCNLDGGTGPADGKIFVTRIRGFWNVPPTLVGRPIYLGMVSQDAAYMQIFDKLGGRVPIFAMGPSFGEIGRRGVNTVQFASPGLYPVEIGHYTLTKGAYLEVAMSPKTVFSMEAGDPPNTAQGSFQELVVQTGTVHPLNKWSSFELLRPEWFFQSASGKHAFSDVNVCKQCPRSEVGLQTAPSCGAGMYCNEAALCDKCTTNDHCGASCQKCQGNTPVCDGASCVECTQDADCAIGNSCINKQCKPCTADASCAGNSCNCCSGGAQCLPSTSKGQYVCGNCKQDADCESGKRCDPSIMQCVADAGSCPFDPASPVERCGPGCDMCPGERPFCLSNVVCVQCRSDQDCSAGNYCLSGECSPCITDKRCGSRCQSCTASNPLCFHEGNTAEKAQCVQCLENSQCGPGSLCDPVTHVCSTACTQCAGNPSGEVCLGDRCVQCISSAQCPCGSICNTKTGQCSPGCESVEDCSGSQCCSKLENKCVPGRCKPGRAAGGALCCSASMDGSCGCATALSAATDILLDRPATALVLPRTPWVVWLMVALLVSLLGGSAWFFRRRLAHQNGG